MPKEYPSWCGFGSRIRKNEVCIKSLWLKVFKKLDLCITLEINKCNVFDSARDNNYLEDVKAVWQSFCLHFLEYGYHKTSLLIRVPLLWEWSGVSLRFAANPYRGRLDTSRPLQGPAQKETNTFRLCASYYDFQSLAVNTTLE